MKKRSKFKRFILETIAPFLTICVIVFISIAIFVETNRATDGNTAIIILVMIVTISVLSIAFLAVDKIRRKITNEIPAQEILEATQKIARGDFSVRLTTTHAFDLNKYDLIKENLNAMAAELEKSEILKTDFISNISHELKTPLTIIQSHVSLLKGDVDEQTKQKYVSIIISATKRLTNLVTNILKLNKLEHQELNIDYKKIRLADMLSNAVIEFEDLIDKKQLEIECDFDEVELISSESYLEIVWNNLLSNAIKFTDIGGKITVTLKKTTDGCAVEITDTGCGISPETGARIFDKFYQGDTSHSSEGNGLGLALVKKVITLIGGEISVKSQVGMGSTFKVILKNNDR